MNPEQSNEPQIGETEKKEVAPAVVAPENANPETPSKPNDLEATVVDVKEESAKKEESSEYAATDFMSRESVGKVMWKLTYPSLIAKVVSALYAVCDSMFIGKLAGETQDDRTIALAAVSLAMPLEQGIIHSLAMMVSNGGSTVFGQSIGEKNPEKGKRVVGNTFFMEIVVAVILAGVFSWFTKPLLKLVGATESQGNLDIGASYISTLF